LASLEGQVKGWYEQSVRALSLPIEGAQRASLLLGMGGSGIVGDYVKAMCVDRLDVPVFVVKEARLPRWVKGDSLVVAISYSGNTLETVAAAREALARGALTCVVSSGGRLMELAESRGLPRVRLEGGYAPRAALPMMLYSCLRMLREVGIEVVEPSEVEESLELLRDVEGSLSEASAIARSLVEDRTPVIVADARYEALAWRFKSDLNENAKMSAKCEVVPESMHNDVVGYEGDRHPSRALILSAGDDHPYTRIVEGFVREALEEAGVEVRLLRLKGSSMLAKLMYGSHVSSLASIEAARLLGMDPEPTRNISRYKRALEQALR